MTKHNNLYGIFFMLVNTLSLAALHLINKKLLSGLPSSQTTLFYKVIVFVFLAPWVLRNGLKGIKTPALPLHILRAFLSITAGLCFAYGLKNSGLVNSVALSYIEQVLWAIIGVMYFKEKMTTIKFFAICMSFIAMVLITAPGLILSIFARDVQGTSVKFDYNSIFVLAAGIFWALNSTAIKILGKTVKNEVQAFYMLLLSIMIAYPAAFIDWNWHQIGNTFLAYPTFSRLIGLSEVELNAIQCIQLLMMAGLYYIHVWSFFLALKYAEMSTLAPFDYTRLVFTCVLAYLFIGELPKHATQYVGYIMIIVSGLLLVNSERKKKATKKEKIEQLETQIENR